jgi:hypothetical protein
MVIELYEKEGTEEENEKCNKGSL